MIQTGTVIPNSLGIDRLNMLSYPIALINTCQLHRLRQAFEIRLHRIKEL
uniref:Uncharacterized protein n=1 Tax=Arundo donax TaxID=35708 RepID=A0A0A9HB13_ARUDO